MYKSILDSMFKNIPESGLTVRYWDGQEISYGPNEPAFRIIFTRQPNLPALAKDPILGLGTCYMDGEIELDGEMTEMIRLMDALCQVNMSRNTFSMKMFAAAMQGINTVKDRLIQKENIHTHYDLGNDFFRMWLDETMSYSCAYFSRPEDSLHQAQLNKIDLVLKKLDIKPGMRLLEIGCGWGWLSLAAARDYGATVVGITLSEEQVAGATKRIQEAGLSDRVEIRLQNYLDLDPAKEQFDRISSVGMFEHVGLAYFTKYMEKVRDLLAPGGVTMLHTLSKLKESEVNPWISKYIFPGGYLPTLRELFTLFPDYDLNTLHVESLRRHYAKTLACWHENYSRPDVLAKVRAMFDERFVRMWSLYLRSAGAALQCGSIDVHQIVLSKGVNNALGMTMERVYCGA